MMGINYELFNIYIYTHSTPEEFYMNKKFKTN